MFSTPPYAGGLRDQPIRLMKEIRLALYAWNSFKSWKMTSGMSTERFNAFCSTNQDLLKFMEHYWRLQDDASDGERQPS